MSQIHTVRFSYAHLIMLVVFITPGLIWVVNEHYQNQNWHIAQEHINARMDQRITALEDHYQEMMAQHAKIIGRLEVIQGNQMIVLETLSGLNKTTRTIRKAIEDAP